MGLHGHEMNDKDNSMKRMKIVVLAAVLAVGANAPGTTDSNEFSRLVESMNKNRTAPVEEIPATDYALTVGGQPVFARQARVSAFPLNQVWPGYQRPLAQTEIASFAAWDHVGAGGGRGRQRPPGARRCGCGRGPPGSRPSVEGDTIRFTIAKPGQYTVEVNGTHRALHLFANPPEEAAADPRNPNVLYFGPGVHCPGLIRLTSGQTVYLAGGAVVYGAILAEKAENIVIRGCGILDGSKFDRMALHRSDLSVRLRQHPH